jgi:hypothetical protein
MATYTVRALAALTILITTLPVSGNAAGTVVRARFSFDALATCTQPAVQNYPVHAEGHGTLSTDRTATLDMSSNIQGKETYTAKLGGGPPKRSAAQRPYASSTSTRFVQCGSIRTTSSSPR